MLGRFRMTCTYANLLMKHTTLKVKDAVLNRYQQAIDGQGAP
jgi:hypothetical protein